MLIRLFLGFCLKPINSIKDTKRNNELPKSIITTITICYGEGGIKNTEISTKRFIQRTVDFSNRNFSLHDLNANVEY
jgi:hypothetical protein